MLTVSGCSIIKNNSNNNDYLTIGNKTISIEIAGTKDEQRQGLSNRDNLCDDCGLLFLFYTKGEYSFWMKDMKFPIDIIWLNDDKIVYIEKNASVPSNSYIPTYQPKVVADKVLEVNAGFCDKYSIKVGDTLKMLTKQER